jgi:Na+-translocating ferredoxin:NAD+ oxidoreductase RnfA subunit
MLGVSFGLTVGPYVISSALGLEPHPGVSVKVDAAGGLSLAVKALLVSFNFSIGQHTSNTASS